MKISLNLLKLHEEYCRLFSRHGVYKQVELEHDTAVQFYPATVSSNFPLQRQLYNFAFRSQLTILNINNRCLLLQIHDVQGSSVCVVNTDVAAV